MGEAHTGAFIGLGELGSLALLGLDIGVVVELDLGVVGRDLRADERELGVVGRELTALRRELGVVGRELTALRRELGVVGRELAALR